MVSNINATLPADGAPASKSDLRANLAAAKAEIEALQALFGNTNPYIFNGMRNRLINGSMNLQQRGTVTNVAGSTEFAADRWYVRSSAASAAVFTAARTSTNPQPLFPNYERITVGTPITIAATHQHYFGQRVELEHWKDMQWGTPSAAPASLSFWVRASIAGTYAVAFTDTPGTGGTSYVTTYTVINPNTWERKEISIPAPTIGTWTNSATVAVCFDLGSGSNYYGTLNTWATPGSQTRTSAAGVVPLLQVTGATWEVTGVQLEPGAVASPYEHRLLAMEQAMAQRYYYKSSLNWRGYGTAGTPIAISHPLRSIMLGTPSITRSNESIVNVNTPASDGTKEAANFTGVVTSTGNFTWTCDYTVSMEMA